MKVVFSLKISLLSEIVCSILNINSTLIKVYLRLFEILNPENNQDEDSIVYVMINI